MAILAAGINFGKPNTEFIVESDENGVAQSCRNVDTGIEYVGGGGSSDFSTAEVTFNLSASSSSCEIYGVCINPDDDNLYAFYEVESGETKIVPIVIYKNKTPVVVELDLTESQTVVVSGDIESPERTFLEVSGNGIVTISG